MGAALTLQRYIENYNAEIDALKSEIDVVKPELLQAKSDLEEKSLEVERLSSEVEKKNVEIEELNNSLTEISESLEKTQETLFQKLEEFEELKKTKETTENPLAAPEDHTYDTKQNIAELEKTIEDQTHCISKYEAQINQLEDRNAKLSEEIKTIIATQEEVSLKKPIDDTSQKTDPELEILRSRLQETESKLKSALDQIEDLEEDASAATDIFNQLKSLEQQYAQVQQKNQELQQK